MHDASFRRGLRKVRVASTTAEELATFDVPRLADLYVTCGTDFELSIDAKEPAVMRAMADDRARAAGARTAVDLLTGPRAAPRRSASRWRTCGSSTPPATARCRPRTSNGTAPISRRPGSTRSNLHHADWTLGTVTLAHRFDLRAFAWDTQETRHILAMLRHGIDGVYCDRVDRMVAAVGEWALTAAQIAGRRFAQHEVADDRRRRRRWG